MRQTVELWLVGIRRGGTIEWEPEARGEEYSKSWVRIKHRDGCQPVLRRVEVEVEMLLSEKRNVVDSVV